MWGVFMKFQMFDKRDIYEIFMQLALTDIPVFVCIFAGATLFGVEFCKQLTIMFALINTILGIILIVMKMSYERSEWNERHR